MFNAKINLKNGKEYIIKHNHTKVDELLNELLGNGKPGVTVNILPLSKETVFKDLKFNTVAILGTEISSVEIYTE